MSDITHHTQKNHAEQLLLVDDDPAQLLLLSLSLQDEGYTIITAENGREALKIWDNNPNLQMIITDLSMPEMDGFELIKEIRERQIRYMYLIVLTGLGDKESVVKALSLGADDYISKPAMPEELKLRTTSGFRLLQLEGTEELILAMAKLSEYRSEETGFHLERVQHYTRILARDLVENYPELNISMNGAEDIARVSPLHDIGKVAIPDSILHKPGRLTVEEFEEIKTHTTIGGELLQDIYNKTGLGSIKTAADIAFCHHEHFNGNGYPRALKGEAIPIAARIMALADIYDALTSERSYKHAMSHADAKRLIMVERGNQLDPRVIDAFVRQEDLWQAVAERFTDSAVQ